MVCNTEDGLEHEHATAMMARELGLPIEILDSKQIAAMEPALRISAAGGIYFPKDAYLAPWQFMAALKKRVEVQWKTSISLRPNGKRVDSDLKADEYVICGGAWSSAIARDLQLHLPMQAGKGYSLTLQRPRKVPRHAMILSEARIAVTPMLDSLRFGGTMEISGNDLSINPARVRGIIKAVPKYLPEFSADDFRDVQPWAGLRPCSPDGVPYIGRFARYENLSVATGHAMMGLSLGPITGQLMAELLSDEPTSIPLSQLSPDRYA
jgi:D-amino-acid dehydrogenase